MADQYGAKSSLCSTILSVGEDADDATLMKNFADFSNSYWGKDFCSGGFCESMPSLHFHPFSCRQH
jgi:hypothetical protein